MHRDPRAGALRGPPMVAIGAIGALLVAIVAAVASTGVLSRSPPSVALAAPHSWSMRSSRSCIEGDISPRRVENLQRDEITAAS